MPILRRPSEIHTWLVSKSPAGSPAGCPENLSQSDERSCLLKSSLYVSVYPDIALRPGGAMPEGSEELMMPIGNLSTRGVAGDAAVLGKTEMVVTTMSGKTARRRFLTAFAREQHRLARLGLGIKSRCIRLAE